MIRRLPFLLILLATPAAADIPTKDGVVLDERRDRNEAAGEIDEVDRDRHASQQSVTCAVYRSGRKGPIAAANANPSIAGLVRRIAREEKVGENEFLALVYQESRFNPCARSGAGAIGLAQLMPGTASDLGVNPYDIEQNLRGGARYFRQQLQHFNGNVSLALAAYNSGSGNVESYGGVPPFRETQAYVSNITQKWLPAFGGSDKSGIPLNYGGASTAYEYMRSSTISAMGLTSATSDGSGNVASWFEQFGSVINGTVQDSWDRNSGARNANIEMLNRMIALEASFAALVNSENAVTLSDISGANRSSRSHGSDSPGSQDNIGFCGGRADLVWNAHDMVCVRRLDANAALLFSSQ